MTPQASQQVKEAVRAKVGQLTKRNNAVMDESYTVLLMVRPW